MGEVERKEGVMSDHGRAPSGPATLRSAASADDRGAARDSAASRPGPARPSSGIHPLDRNARIDEKIRLLVAALAELPAPDPRVRLARLAALRRDEVLLDGLLAEVHSAIRRASDAASPPRSRG
ncbi:MAG TPA: hypothetical protein PLU22_08030 [Polyangiaceae bacterium]|nr:hypothetical protein [Polyangiaceae bacterium]